MHATEEEFTAFVHMLHLTRYLGKREVTLWNKYVRCINFSSKKVQMNCKLEIYICNRVCAGGGQFRHNTCKINDMLSTIFNSVYLKLNVLENIPKYQS